MQNDENVMFLQKKMDFKICEAKNRKKLILNSKFLEVISTFFLLTLTKITILFLENV